MNPYPNRNRLWVAAKFSVSLYFVVTGTPILLCQVPIADILGGDLERPPDPPLITYSGIIAMSTRMATDPSIVPSTGVARVVYKEYQVSVGGQAQTPTLSRTLATELDGQGRQIAQNDRQGSLETNTTATYVEGNIVKRVSTSMLNGKSSGPEVWSRWSYAAGHVVDFRRGRGNQLQNHYTNMKHDPQGRLTSIEYRQGSDDQLQYRTEYKYAADGKTLDVSQYDAMGERLRSQYRTLDEHGRIARLEVNEKNWETKTWDNPLRVTFAYDTEGRLVQQVSEPHEVEGGEMAIPPGQITLAYDDKRHSRVISYAQKEENLKTEVQFDGNGSITSVRIDVGGLRKRTEQIKLECTYDDHANWTECRRWVGFDDDRRLTGLWRREITYR